MVTVEEFDGMEDTTLQKWNTKRCDITVKGKVNSCQKTMKENIECKKRDMDVAFEESLCKFLQHTACCVQPISFCTISDNLRHDTPAICAHLLSVIDELRKHITNLKLVHFVSDGPTTQYRNRTFLAPALNEEESIHWRYSETCHGKGAPDGI
ncbi:hypothetical protein PR048_012412 [Dryococelus australis]|uniref:Uncharacterized protein n=1 Tax=Dryococelus australis TaxID=614101 RepID=A0ABQ9HPC1_9NEOP|nr:hypothetical protein PR048_012412 [Dryococelus australis]